MRVLDIHGAQGLSRILVGESLGNMGKYLPGGKTVIITDEPVAKLYGDAFPPGERIVIGQGEEIKTLDTMKTIYDRLIELEADRATYIVGIGGGIVCDIAGFVASTYMRGVRFGFAATTLLAQVDASVGGKSGVNVGGYKNMVGVYNQPEFIICDVGILSSLPVEQRACGFAEIIKHAAIADAAQIDYLEKHRAEILDLDPELMENLVYASVGIKAGVVNRDEKETGERRKLNFGHTLGHAIQKAAGWAHGPAVAAGMVAAAGFSVQRKFLSREDAARLQRLIEAYDLPTRAGVEAAALVDAVRRDKKRERDEIHFVFLDQLGSARVEKVTLNELERMLLAGWGTD